ncbi:MAG TPA: DUF1178 family protein [Alphaproteobacteria bacterium]|jgi:hypothetical protein|nr:DUF1178 family protein [Alphaproteobacteria bacterium]
MILFDLKCHAGHVFEAWFRDGATFEVQQTSGDIGCPICGETRIAKAPMAPHIARGGNDLGRVCNGEEQLAGELLKELERVCRHIEDNADYVGGDFPDEARRIKSGEAEPRDIYGEASESDTQALIDEGVEVHRIPWIRRRHHS